MVVLLAVAAMVSPDFLQASPDLDKIAASVFQKARQQFPKMEADQLSIAVGTVDRKSSQIMTGQHNGEGKFYPASTVKLFYLAYSAQLIESKKLKLTKELERGFTDMIVDSINDATGYILDSITGTTGGPELEDKELKKWVEKRNVVNRWLTKLGFTGVNANQKTWNEGPYGRERQGYGPNFEYRNSLTANAGVRMMGLIALDKLAGPQQAAWMKKLLSRKVVADSPDADLQSKEFTGEALPKGTLLWSKAGYTSTARCDIAWFKLPSGHEYIFSIFTKGQSNEPKLIPFVARQLLTELGEESTPGE